MGTIIVNVQFILLQSLEKRLKPLVVLITGISSQAGMLALLCANHNVISIHIII